MATKSVKYTQLKLNLETKTPKSKMPIISPGVAKLKKNIYSNTVNQNNNYFSHNIANMHSQDEQLGLRNKVKSSRSESRNGNMKYNSHQKENINKIGFSVSNYVSNKLPQLNNEEDKHQEHIDSSFSPKKKNQLTSLYNPSKFSGKKINVAQKKIPIQEPINILSLLNNQNNTPISTNNLKIHFPTYESTKFSHKSMGIIKAYAANTNQGIVRYINSNIEIIMKIGFQLSSI